MPKPRETERNNSIVRVPARVHASLDRYARIITATQIKRTSL